ncbi:MAG TPA: hypothetical protein PLN91_01015, partial [Rhodanobacteraceae bacterium]|nr:hypothetical protein [Rhodanobacteraceae bacterium]
EAIASRATSMAFDADTRLTPEEQAVLSRSLGGRDGEWKPSPGSTAITHGPSGRRPEMPAPVAQDQAQEILAAGDFVLRQLRRERGEEACRLIDEITWSMLGGQLAGLAKTASERWAVALRLVRTGKWSTPHGYPSGRTAS